MLAFGMGGLSLSAFGCGGKKSSGSDSGSSSLDSTTDAVSKGFLDRYVTSDGRVQRIDQGGDTVGEGQSYGMLIAAAAGDEKRFDSIWDWTKNNIQRSDGLLSFLWRDGKVVDPQAAADADVDAARALLAGSCRFDRPALREEALTMGKAIMAEETASFQGADVLTAGPWARKPPITLNPSYFSPATFAALGTASKDGRWGSLSATSRTVTDSLLQGSSRLPPDWAQVEGDRVVPIGSPGQPKSKPLFGFDAVRTLVRLAEDPDPAGRRIAARSWPVFEGPQPGGHPGRARPHRQAGRQLDESGGARGGRRRGRCRRRHEVTGPPAGRGTGTRQALADLLRRGVGGARAHHAPHGRPELQLTG